MANQFLSLLDITARGGTDAAVGLVEEVSTYAPELEKIMGRPIPGKSYLAKIRTALTANAAFRAVNTGTGVGASRYTQKRFDCFMFDAQLQVDEAEALASEQQGDSLAELQADEAAGAVRAKAINLGQQIWGSAPAQTSGTVGFPGATDLLTSQLNVIDTLTSAAINQSVDAGGSSSSCERVWYVWNHLQGFHLLFGGNQGLDIEPWRKQVVTDTSNAANRYFAWVSNVKGLIGLSMAHIRAVGCIRNVDATFSNNAYTKPWTDAMSARLWALFPVGLKPNLCFASRGAIASLQAARTVTIFANAGTPTARTPGVTGSIAAWPTSDINGVPIIPTDSILKTAQQTY